MVVSVAWTEITSPAQSYGERIGSIWDLGASIWDVTDNVATTFWDVTTDSWSNEAQIDTTWSDA